MRRFAVSITLFGALLLAACNGSSGSTDGGRANASNKTFTMALASDPGVFDPYHSQLIFGYAKLAYDSLVNIQPDGKVVSGLAEKWSADARSATFDLRPGITCSDGTPLTATQVAAAIGYVSDPKNKSPQYGVNVPTVPLRATGDDASRTVKVAMTKEPFGFLLNTVGQLPIMCSKGLRTPSLLKKASDGTGPFVLTDIAPGQRYTFTVRKGYDWGPAGASTTAPGTPAKVVLRVVSNESTAANLLLSGELNLAVIGGEDRQRLDARGLRRIERSAPMAWLWFNHLGNRPTADTRIRQSLVSALDLDEIVKVSTGGVGHRATGLVLDPAPCPGDTVTAHMPKYDVALANGQLNADGWVKGSDGIRTKGGKRFTLDLHYVPSLSPTLKPTAELIAEKWGTIGIKVKLTAETFATMNQSLFSTSNYDVYLGGFGFNLPTQSVPYLSGPIPPKGTNVAGVVNKEYNTLATKAAAMTPPEACEYWNDAEVALWRNLDIVPISTRPQLYYLTKATAQGMPYNTPIPTSIRMLG